MFTKNATFSASESKMLASYLLLFLVPITSTKLIHLGRRLEDGGLLGYPETLDFKHWPHIRTEWFEQSLNHFDPSDERTWKQRYFVNDEYYGGASDGPVFLQISGEAAASIKWMGVENPWVTYAKQYKALCFQVEHRYYGESHPTADLSTKNLQYLTSQQALADLANFIVAMNDKYKFSSNIKWIVFGGSYAGSLAAWMRAKYPFLVHGAMSASGPLLAEVDFIQYFKVVTDSLRTHSDACVTAVRASFHQVDLLLRTENGRKYFTEHFHACNLTKKFTDNRNDVSTLYDTLAGNFADVVQYNKDNRQNNNVTIDDICDIMTNQTLGTPVVRLGLVNALVTVRNQSCVDYSYESSIQSLKEVKWENATVGGRQWTYQTCTEFGFYQTSSQPDHTFGDHFPVDYYIQQCVDIFGPKYNEHFLDAAVQRTNTLYGGLDIEATNVVYVQGSIDPWHALGITETKEQAAPAIYIEGTAHCANMYPPGKDDPPQLRAAREEVGELIGDWLGLADCLSFFSLVSSTNQ